MMAVVVLVAVAMQSSQDPAYQTGFNDALTGHSSFFVQHLGVSGACSEIYKMEEMSGHQDWLGGDQSHYDPFMAGCRAGMAKLGY
jgi:hypothetical protein